VTCPFPQTEPAEDARIVAAALDWTKARLTRVSLGTALCVLGGATLASLLAFVVADHYLPGGVPLRLRNIGLAVYATAMLVAAIVLIFLPAARRISDVYAARLIERRHPAFRNSLTNAVQLEKRADLPGSIRAALVARAAADVASADLRRAVALDRLRLAGMGLGVVAFAFLIYSAAAPKPVWPSVRRALGSSIPAPTRTRIVHLEPADNACALIGRPVTFVAALGGRMPREAVIQFSLDAGATLLSGQRLVLSRAGRGSGQATELWQATKPGPDVQYSMYWKLVAGDAESSWRRLIVRPPPDVAALRLTCTYPRYTGMPPRGISPDERADVQAVVGTQVTVEAETNVPVREPALVVCPAGGVETQLPMRYVDLDPQRIAGEFVVQQDGDYYLRFYDRTGEPNHDPIRYAIRARPDEPPAIRLVEPAGDLELAADDGMRLEAEVTDDFGLAALAIEYRCGGRTDAISIPLPPTAGGPAAEGSAPTSTGPADHDSASADRASGARPVAWPRRVTVRTVVPVAQFGARPGETIEWQLAASDNRTGPDSAGGEPAPQKGLGPLRRIVIRTAESIAAAPSSAEVAQPPSSAEPGVPATQTAEGRAGQTSPDADAQPGEQPEDRPDMASAKPAPQAPNDMQAESAQEAESLRDFLRRHEQELSKLREYLLSAAEAQQPESSDASREAAGPDASQPPGDDSSAAKSRPEIAQRQDDRGEAGEDSAITELSAAPTAPRGGPTQPVEPAGEGAESQPSEKPASDRAEAVAAPEARAVRHENDRQHQTPTRAPTGTEGSESAEQQEHREAPDSGDGSKRHEGEGEGEDERDSRDTGEGREAHEAEASEQADGQGKSDRQSRASPQAPSKGRGSESAEGREEHEASDSTEGTGEGSKRHGGEGEGEDERGSRDTAEGREAREAEASEQADGQGKSDRSAPTPAEVATGGEGSQADQHPGEAPSEAKGEASAAGGGHPEGTADGRAPGEKVSADAPGAADRGGVRSTADVAKPGGDLAQPQGESPAGATVKRPGFGPAGGGSAPMTGGRDESRGPAPSAQPPGQADPPRLEGLGDVLPVIDALEQRLRKKELTPELLEDLGWDEQRAEDFVRRFRRAERALREHAGVGPVGRIETTTRPSRVVESAAGASEDVAVLESSHVRPTDNTNQLFEVGRQKITEEYRDILRAYYESVSAGHASTRPTR